MTSQAALIKKFILAELPKHSSDIVAYSANKFNVTRTTIHRHLQSLIKMGQVIKSGTTKNIYYVLSSNLSRKFTYKIKPGLDEFKIYANDFKNSMTAFSEILQDTISYSFTEIVNNAIDHSRGKTIIITTQLEKNKFILSIKDDGVGIFKNIHDYFHLDDLRESILQLTKGKTTTDPVHHTGEGIFFSSRAAYLFEIYANGLHFIRDNKENDWSISKDVSLKQGSQVIMTYLLDSKLDLVTLFKNYQDEESLAFNRTEIVVKLSKFDDETFISRSQAKRILRNLDKFQRVTLDFKDVRLVGQGFVDEIFRVYQNQHPEMEFNYINASDDVTFMIQRCKK